MSLQNSLLLDVHVVIVEIYLHCVVSFAAISKTKQECSKFEEENILLRSKTWTRTGLSVSSLLQRLTGVELKWKKTPVWLNFIIKTALFLIRVTDELRSSFKQARFRIPSVRNWVCKYLIYLPTCNLAAYLYFLLCYLLFLIIRYSLHHVNYKGNLVNCLCIY